MNPRQGRRWSWSLRRNDRKQATSDRRTIVCPCHDATLADLRNSWAAGYQHPETVKRATAVFMGPCQGKMCAPAVAAIVAELQGADEPFERRPSARPPLYPVRIGDLADADELDGDLA